MLAQVVKGKKDPVKKSLKNGGSQQLVVIWGVGEKGVQGEVWF